MARYFSVVALGPALCVLAADRHDDYPRGARQNLPTVLRSDSIFARQSESEFVTQFCLSNQSVLAVNLERVIRQQGSCPMVAMQANTFDLNHQALLDEATAQKLVGLTVAEVERVMILRTLDHFDGNRTRASACLGISVRCLRDKIHQLKNSGAAVPAPVPAIGSKGRSK